MQNPFSFYQEFALSFLFFLWISHFLCKNLQSAEFFLNNGAQFATCQHLGRPLHFYSYCSWQHSSISHMAMMAPVPTTDPHIYVSAPCCYIYKHMTSITEIRKLLPPNPWTFFFYGVIVMQPLPVLGTHHHISHQAICLPRPAREYGTMAPPVEDSTWWDASVKLSRELVFQTKSFRLGLLIEHRHQDQGLHRMGLP